MYIYFLFSESSIKDPTARARQASDSGVSCSGDEVCGGSDNAVVVEKGSDEGGDQSSDSVLEPPLLADETAHAATNSSQHFRDASSTEAGDGVRTSHSLKAEKLSRKRKRQSTVQQAEVEVECPADTSTVKPWKIEPSRESSMEKEATPPRGEGATPPSKKKKKSKRLRPNTDAELVAGKNSQLGEFSVQQEPTKSSAIDVTGGLETAEDGATNWGDLEELATDLFSFSSNKLAQKKKGKVGSQEARVAQSDIVETPTGKRSKSPIKSKPLATPKEEPENTGTRGVVAAEVESAPSETREPESAKSTTMTSGAQSVVEETPKGKKTKKVSEMPKTMPAKVERVSHPAPEAQHTTSAASAFTEVPPNVQETPGGKDEPLKKIADGERVPSETNKVKTSETESASTITMTSGTPQRVEETPNGKKGKTLKKVSKKTPEAQHTTSAAPAFTEVPPNVQETPRVKGELPKKIADGQQVLSETNKVKTSELESALTVTMTSGTPQSVEETPKGKKGKTPKKVSKTPKAQHTTSAAPVISEAQLDIEETPKGKKTRTPRKVSNTPKRKAVKAEPDSDPTPEVRHPTSTAAVISGAQSELKETPVGKKLPKKVTKGQQVVSETNPGKADEVESAPSATAASLVRPGALEKPAGKKNSSPRKVATPKTAPKVSNVKMEPESEGSGTGGTPKRKSPSTPKAKVVEQEAPREPSSESVSTALQVDIPQSVVGVIAPSAEVATETPKTAKKAGSKTPRGKAAKKVALTPKTEPNLSEAAAEEKLPKTLQAEVGSQKVGSSASAEVVNPGKEKGKKTLKAAKKESREDLINEIMNASISSYVSDAPQSSVVRKATKRPASAIDGSENVDASPTASTKKRAKPKSAKSVREENGDSLNDTLRKLVDDAYSSAKKSKPKKSKLDR